MPHVRNISFDKKHYEKLQEIKKYYQIKASFIDDISDGQAIRILIREWKPSDRKLEGRRLLSPSVQNRHLSTPSPQKRGPFKGDRK